MSDALSIVVVASVTPIVPVSLVCGVVSGRPTRWSTKLNILDCLKHLCVSVAIHFVDVRTPQPARGNGETYNL